MQKYITSAQWWEAKSGNERWLGDKLEMTLEVNVKEPEHLR